MHIDIVGKRFGRLTVLRRLDEYSSKHRLFESLCDCGTLTKSNSQQLREGRKKSCGCLKAETAGTRSLEHGMSKTPIHNIWCSMVQRCTDVKHKYYSSYGGRGINVSEDWLDFKKFYADMGDKPEGLSIDRIDNNLGYSKENCRWATRKEQANNRRSSKTLEFNGETKTYAQWEDALNLRRGQVWERLDRGWSVERTLTTPTITKYL